MKNIKHKFFSKIDVVFHSFEMRKRVGVYKIFQDEEILQDFYRDIGKIFTDCNYKIISCVIDKEAYKNKYVNKNKAYEDSLTFLCERAIKYIGTDGKHTLHFCLEKRTKGKDIFLKRHYTDFVKYGTQYLSTHACRICHPKLHFRGKDENINGLQLADLCAYPIARKNLSPESPQPTYDLFESKFYSNSRGEYIGLGLKKFP